MRVYAILRMVCMKKGGKGMKKKALSLFIVLSLALTAMPIAAWADSSSVAGYG